MWVFALVTVHADYGSHYQACINNVHAVADFWQAYEQVIPKSWHRAVSKKSGQTSLTNAV
jgi:hypothetical protein